MAKRGASTAGTGVERNWPTDQRQVSSASTFWATPRVCSWEIEQTTSGEGASSSLERMVPSEKELLVETTPSEKRPSGVTADEGDWPSSGEYTSVGNPGSEGT